MTLPGRPVRIAHVIQNLNYGGMERLLHGLAQRLPGEGFDVHIVVLQYLGRFSEGLGGQVTFHQVPPMSKGSLLYPRRLAGTFRQIAPAIVHSHSGVWLKASRAARIARVPVVVHTDHGRPDRVPLGVRLLDNLASRSTDAVIAVSDALAQVLRAQVVHRPDQVRVIINGVDVDSLRPAGDQEALRVSLGFPTDRPVIGSIGRLEPVKNYRLALDGFARLLAQHPSPRPLLVLAGDGSERATLERHAAALGIAGDVRFLGWRDDAEQLYPAFDIFTLTSLSEGTSVSLLESMSAGVCPLVTDVGGNRAVLGSDLASNLVASGDSAGLADGWARLLASPEARRKAGTVARARIAERYSIDRMLKEHVALYRELLARRGASSA